MYTEEPQGIPLREWQKRFLEGAFDKAGYEVEQEAGCWGLFVSSTVSERVKAAATLILGIREPYILDNFFVNFSEYSPDCGPYDVAYFDPLGDVPKDRRFAVIIGSRRERRRWALMTERYNHRESAEFECRHVRSMVKYINSIAHELEAGVVPEFERERKAVMIHLLLEDLYAGGLMSHGAPIHRLAEHRYACISASDDKWREYAVVKEGDAAPQDFAEAVRHTYSGYCVYGRRVEREPEYILDRQIIKARPKRKNPER